MTVRSKQLIFKLLSLFSVVRGYNIFVLIVAQYLASIFIFSPTKSILSVLVDVDLHFIILATVCVVSSGYIINNFYDEKIDLINRPFKTKIDNYIHQNTKLQLYFFLNFLGFIFGLLVSLKAALFFSAYIFGIWLYSHKLKKYPFLGLFTATCLTILPFFAIFIYYKNFSKIIFVHAIFLFLVLMIREVLKDLENIKGAIVGNYKTLPVVYGETKAKQFIAVNLILTLVAIFFIFKFPELSYMRYYFYFAFVVLSFVAFFLVKSVSQHQYRNLHNLLKILLLIGVLSLVLIDTSLIVEKVLDKVM